LVSLHSFKDENSTAMKVKIDTKEVFHVITIEEKELSANMAAVLMQIIDKKQTEDLKNLVLNFKDVQTIDPTFLDLLQRIRDSQYQQQKSFVACELSANLKGQLNIDNEFDRFHVTPTESEAWDIVQMEEIERELGLDI
jgi:anti-anti-sigma regulatory factor